MASVIETAFHDQNRPLGELLLAAAARAECSRAPRDKSDDGGVCDEARLRMNVGNVEETLTTPIKSAVDASYGTQRPPSVKK